MNSSSRSNDYILCGCWTQNLVQRSLDKLWIPKVNHIHYNLIYVAPTVCDWPLYQIKLSIRNLIILLLESEYIVGLRNRQEVLKMDYSRIPKWMGIKMIINWMYSSFPYFLSWMTLTYFQHCAKPDILVNSCDTLLAHNPYVLAHTLCHWQLLLSILLRFH